MTDLYVSAAGSDTNPGTIDSPWRTITRLNAHIASGVMRLGDRIFLRRGDVFYGRLIQPDYIDPALKGWLIVDAYGTGAKPVIDGYKTITTWTNHATNVWRVDYTASGAGTRYTGYDSAQGGGDVGHLVTDGTVRGVRRTSIAGLVNNWDFYSDGTTLYVRATANPSTLATQIKVAIDGDGSNLRSGVWLRNVHVRGHGGHGVNGPGLGGTTRSRVTNCEVSYCGGSALDGYGDGNVRYGNGIQVWINSSDVLIANNVIHDCYDVGITAQGGSSGQTQTFTNINIRRNITYRNSQAIEFWYGGEGAGFVNCVVDYNVFMFSGYGWGAQVRPEQQTRVHLLTFAWGSAGPTMRRNIYWDAAYAFRYSEENPVNLQGQNNIIALRAGTLMTHQTAQTIEQAQSWAAADGHETNLNPIILASGGGTADSDVTAALNAMEALGFGQKGGSSKLFSVPGFVKSLVS